MRTYKVKLMFGKMETWEFWVSRLRLVREAYNLVSATVFAEKVQLGLKPVHHRCYRELRSAFPTLPSQMCIQVERSVLANYRSARGNGHKPEEPIRMRNPALQLDRRSVSNLTRSGMRLPGAEAYRREEVRFLTYPKFDELASLYGMCDPKLRLVPAGLVNSPNVGVRPSKRTDLQSVRG